MKIGDQPVRQLKSKRGVDKDACFRSNVMIGIARLPVLSQRFQNAQARGSDRGDLASLLSCLLNGPQRRLFKGEMPPRVELTFPGEGIP